MRRCLIAACVVLIASAAFAQDKEAEPIFTQTFEEFDSETGVPAGWSFFGGPKTIEVTDEQAHGGSQSLKLVDEDPENAVGLRSPKIPLKAGEPCWVEWWYRAQPGNNQSMYIEFWKADGSRPEPPSRSFSCRGNGEWEKHIGRYRAPEGTTAVSVHCNSYSNNVATGYFDDVSFGTGAKSIYDRTLKPPVNVDHPCGMYREDDVERSKRNIEKHKWAQGVFNSIKHGADFWMDVPEEKLDYWIPDLTPFRVCDCPNCGTGWRFAWSNPDPDHIKCRKCGFTWPNPEYEETESDTYIDPTGKEQTIPYYRGEPSTEHGAAQTERYRLSGRVRYHRAMKLNSAGNLGLMYALTGETKYAEKFRTIMLRLAEVYPHYLAHDWNRVYEDYSDLQSGKLNGWKLTDAGIFRELATAYDLTYNSGVYSNEDKSIIEERCFREFNRLMTATSPRGCCINDGPFAMAAGALSGLMVADHDTIAWAIEPPGGYIGFLEDYFVRDGHWYEASPSYEGMAMGTMHVTPEVLQGYSDPPSYDKDDRYDNLNLFEHPLMEKIMLAGGYAQMPDGNMPPTNDSTFGASYPATRAEINYNWYPTERNRRIMAWAYGGEVSGGNEYALFRRDPDISFEGVQPLSLSEESCIQPGVGWGLLRTGDGPTDAALFFDYGRHGSGHGHPDRLNVIYYDHGAEMVTDMGYLGWGHPIHPWMRTTLSHNEVIVDGQPMGRAAGELEAYSGGGNTQGIIASAPDVYESAEVYTRNLVFVNHGRDSRYVVDLFHVRGGEDHQYTFHGNSETFTPPGLNYESFDPTELGQDATGYDWLEEAKRAQTPDPFTCEWSTDQHPDLQTRLHMMGEENTELIHAKAPGLRDRHNPFGQRDLYISITRRPGPESRFLSVFEVARTDLGVNSVRELVTSSQNARAVQIMVGEFTDIAVIADADAADETITIEEYPDLQFTGRMGMVSLRDGKPVQLWMLGAKRLSYGNISINGTAEYTGKVTAVNQDDYTLTVDANIPSGKAWQGQQLLIDDHANGAYEMAEIVHRDGESVVRMHNKPIFDVQVGDAFTIRPDASFTLLAEGLWHLAGQPETIQLLDGTPLGDGRIMTLANGSNARDEVYLRTPGGQWKPLPHKRDSSGVHLSLSPETTGKEEAWLWFGDKSPDTSDTAGPALKSADIGGVERESAGDFGYVGDFERAVLTFSDQSALLCDALKVQLVSEDNTPYLLRTHGRYLDTSEGRRYRVTVRPNIQLPPGRYRLSVSIPDRQYNRSEYHMAFNTLGILLPFENMQVVEDSGRGSKVLGSLDTTFYRSQETGDYVAYEFETDPGTYEVFLRYTRYEAYGMYTFFLDGRQVGEKVDAYFEGLDPCSGFARLGTHALDGGRHRLKVEIAGKNDASDNYYTGVCDLVLRPVEVTEGPTGESGE